MEKKYLDIDESTFAYYSNDYVGIYRNELGYPSQPSPIKGNLVDYSTEQNSHHFRSQEFYKLNKDKTNILVAGCSETFGWEIEYKYTWPVILNEYMGNHFDTELFSVAYPGSSIHANIRNIYAFIHNYGNPDYIIMYLADSLRNIFCYKGNLFNVHHNYYMKESVKYTKLFSHENQMLSFSTMLNGLEKYCQAAGIKLLWSTWSPEDFRFFEKVGFSNLHPVIKDYDIIESMRTPDVEKFWDKALDNMHFGYKDHLALAHSFYKGLGYE